MFANDDIESGFVGNLDEGRYIGAGITDVEIVCLKSVNMLARGRRYGRLWLLKGLRPEFRDSTPHRLQMLKEFEIQSRLRNERVAQAIGYEEVEGLGPCIVEEWIDGKTLLELMRDGKITKKERRRLLREIVDAVAYMHSCGVVHRDLKPSNIMVRAAGGSPVIIDFGLADCDNYVELKQAAGTQGYISPEQLSGNSANTSDDMYSLGVIINELYPEYRDIAKKLTGPAEKRPADAMALQAMLRRRSRRPRILSLSVGAAVLAVIVSLTARQMSSLSERAASASTQVTLLTDSLTQVQTKLSNVQNTLYNIEQYEHLKDSALLGGKDMINKTLARYDRQVFSRIGPEKADIFPNTIIQMQNNMLKDIDLYINSLDTTALSKDDRVRIGTDLIQYFTITMSDYHNKWIKRTFQTQQ